MLRAFNDELSKIATEDKNYKGTGLSKAEFLASAAPAIAGAGYSAYGLGKEIAGKGSIKGRHVAAPAAGLATVVAIRELLKRRNRSKEKTAANPFMKPVAKGVTMAANAVKKFRTAGLKRGVAGGLKGGYRRVKPPAAK